MLLSTQHAKLSAIGCKKLLPKWIGPFKVLARVGAVAYRLKLPPHLKWHGVFHVSLLRPYRDSGTVAPPPLPEVIEGEVEYVVESILNHRVLGAGKRPRKQYLVKWEGYGPEHNSWEPEAHLVRCDEALREYWRDREGAPVLAPPNA